AGSFARRSRSQVLAILRADITVIAQPGVEVELPSEIAEAVIRHHQNCRLIARTFGDVANDAIGLDIEVLDNTVISLGLLRRARGMLGVSIPPKHVRLLIGAREIEEQETIHIVIKCVLQQIPALGEDISCLDKLFFFAEY